MCRSRGELSNEYLLAKIGVDTAENEPLEVWGKYSILFTGVLNEAAAADAGPERQAGAEFGANRLANLQSPVPVELATLGEQPRPSIFAWKEPQAAFLTQTEGHLLLG